MKDCDNYQQGGFDAVVNHIGELLQWGGTDLFFDDSVQFRMGLDHIETLLKPFQESIPQARSSLLIRLIGLIDIIAGLRKIDNRKH